MGLYIVKETLAKLGGSIEVTSEFEKGTTFRLVIPNVPPATEK
ncbi:MAG: ATP-binding protein [Marinilabilia sp.]